MNLGQKKERKKKRKEQKRERKKEKKKFWKSTRASLARAVPLPTTPLTYEPRAKRVVMSD